MIIHLPKGITQSPHRERGLDQRFLFRQGRDCNLRHERVHSIAAGARPAKEKLVRRRNSILLVVSALLLSTAWAQQSKPAGVLTAADLKTVVPTSFFYRGQSASTQMRNSAGIRTPEQKYVLAGMVDTSGYATSIAQKYQGFFITEVKVKIEGSELNPGEYGFGFVDDKFLATDCGANEVLSVSSKKDDNLKRAVPLKLTKEGDAYRLYAGKKYVTVELQ